jgi:hypothetical protein
MQVHFVAVAPFPPVGALTLCRQVGTGVPVLMPQTTAHRAQVTCPACRAALR